MSDPTAPVVAGSKHWREIEQIPGIIDPRLLRIPGTNAAAHSTDDPYRDVCVGIRWVRTAGLDWFEYRLIERARVYGETMLFLEKADGSRSWHALAEVKLIRKLS